MSNFRFIEKNLDVSKILQQVLDNPDDWKYVNNLKSDGKDVGGDLDPYGFLPLVMAVVKPGESPKNTEKTQKTELYDKYDEVSKWLRSQGISQLSRAAFFKLGIDEWVGKHIDEGTYYLSRDRYHLSLQGSYYYEVDGEWHTIESGTFFWFDNKKYHQAHNVGDVERITFVFDVPKSEGNP